MTIAALLTALSILIPTVFTFLRVPGPLFPLPLPPGVTATLTVHTPIMVAMFISPFSAVFVAIGSAIGFAITGLPPVVTARAATHVVFAIVGAFMIQKIQGNMWVKLTIVGLVTMILHAVMEALVVIPVLFIVTENPDPTLIYATAYTAGIVTMIHHIVDFVITIGVVSALSKARLIDFKFDSKKKAAFGSFR